MKHDIFVHLFLSLVVIFQRERNALPQEIFRESVEPEKGGKVITLVQTSPESRPVQPCPDLSRLVRPCPD